MFLIVTNDTENCKERENSDNNTDCYGNVIIFWWTNFEGVGFDGNDKSCTFTGFKIAGGKSDGIFGFFDLTFVSIIGTISTRITDWIAENGASNFIREMKGTRNLLKRLFPVDTINIPVELLISARNWGICNILEGGDDIIEAIFNHVSLFARDIGVSITDFEFNVGIGNAGFKFF